MPQAIDGVHQAGADRAQRIAQMLEQRHLQMEMAAAAHAREDRRRATEIAETSETFHSHTEEHEPGENAGHHPGGRRHASPPRHDDDPGGSGHLVDVTA